MSAGTALVVGAGVQGLTVAVLLAETGWDVRVRTDEHPRNTTSSVAGAIWGPSMLRPADRVLDWGTRSYAEFVSLAEDPRTGVRLRPGRIAARFDLGTQVPKEARLLPDLRRCAADELPEGFVSGYAATLPTIDMPTYLDYLVTRFRQAGGELLLSPVPALADAVDEAPVVFNCTGTGAHEFVGDPGVYPVRGQHVVVPNPGIREYFLELSTSAEFTGYVPHDDRVVLGGVAVDHDWDRTPRRETTEGILRRCAEVEPLLTGARVREELVGLRPGRHEVRLDVENYRAARVIHDYGHAGNGVALSWGCAFEAVRLATG